jgi:hypothetical protein
MATIISIEKKKKSAVRFVANPKNFKGITEMTCFRVKKRFYGLTYASYFVIIKGKYSEWPFEQQPNHKYKLIFKAW